MVRHEISLVLFRVISWITFFGAEQAIHEITRTNTNKKLHCRAWDSRLFVQSPKRSFTDVDLHDVAAYGVVI